MTHSATDMSRAAASDELLDAGWRVVLQALLTSVAVTSLSQAVEVATAVAAAAGDHAAAVRIDSRPERVDIGIATTSHRTGFAQTDIDVARRISAAVRQLGLATDASVDGTNRAVQALEIAIDALDIPRIRPFWKAVLAYGDEPGGDGPADAVVDPLGQGPTIWFQQMHEPRPQRNRIHFDIVVPHDEADGRLEAALQAGGTLVSDAEARSFWVLADAEGNEICICTWQDRQA